MQVLDGCCCGAVERPGMSPNEEGSRSDHQSHLVALRKIYDSDYGSLGLLALYSTGLLINTLSLSKKVGNRDENSRRKKHPQVFRLHHLKLYFPVSDFVKTRRQITTPAYLRSFPETKESFSGINT